MNLTKSVKLLILLTCSTQAFADVTLTCRVKGIDRSLGLSDVVISEEVTVVIDESVFLTIDIQGTDSTSSFITSRKSGSVKRVTNLSDSDKWAIDNEGSSKKGHQYTHSIVINRKSGLLSCRKSFGTNDATFSGICTKIVAKKF